MKNDKTEINKNIKVDQQQEYTSDNSDQPLTTNQGLKINNNQDSLKVGERGLSLLENFLLR